MKFWWALMCLILTCGCTNNSQPQVLSLAQGGKTGRMNPVGIIPASENQAPIESFHVPSSAEDEIQDFSKTMICQSHMREGEYQLNVLKRNSRVSEILFLNKTKTNEIVRDEFNLHLVLGQRDQNHMIGTRNFTESLRDDCGVNLYSNCMINLKDDNFDPYSVDYQGRDMYFDIRTSLYVSLDQLVTYESQGFSIHIRRPKITNGNVMYDPEILNCYTKASAPYLSRTMFKIGELKKTPFFNLEFFYQQMVPFLNATNRQFIISNTQVLEQNGLDVLELAEIYIQRYDSPKETTPSHRYPKQKFRLELLDAGARIFFKDGPRNLFKSAIMESLYPCAVNERTYEFECIVSEKNNNINDGLYSSEVRPVLEKLNQLNIGFPLGFDFGFDTYYWKKRSGREPLYQLYAKYEKDAPLYERIRFRDLSLLKDSVFIEYTLRNENFESLLSVPSPFTSNELRSEYNRGGLSVINEFSQVSGVNIIEVAHLQSTVRQHARNEAFSLAHDLCREVNRPFPLDSSMKNFERELKVAGLSLTNVDIEQINEWKRQAVSAFKSGNIFLYSRYVFSPYTQIHVEEPFRGQKLSEPELNTRIKHYEDCMTEKIKELSSMAAHP